MQNTYFFLIVLVFPITFLACGRDTENIRLKRMQEMDKALIAKMCQSNENIIREGRTQLYLYSGEAQMVSNIKFVEELHKQTQELIALPTQEMRMKAVKYRKWCLKELLKQGAIDAKNIQNTFSNELKERYDVLAFERCALQRMGIGFATFCGFERMQTIMHNFDEHLFYMANGARSGYRLEKLWINDVLQTSSKIQIPHLKAGKQTIRIKALFFYKQVPTRDTLIFTTHTFEVLPKTASKK